MGRPSRSAAERNVEDFYAILHEAMSLKKGKLTLQRLGDELGNFDKSTISKKVANKSFTPEERKDILHYIYHVARIFSDEWRKEAKAFPHFFYFALLEFFNVHETSRDNLRNEIGDTYELWRYSVENEGEYVHGKLTFSLDRDTEALRVLSEQPLKSKTEFEPAKRYQTVILLAWVISIWWY